MEKYLSYSTEVQEAMAQGKPVVALESTIISHGMPYPQNVKTAREVEQIVRDNGAVPATIAIIDGKSRSVFQMKNLRCSAIAKELQKLHAVT